MSGVNGERAAFDQAILRSVNLADAVLHEADFLQADLTEADLSRADLQGSRLSAAKLFKTIQSDINLQQAIMPDNSVHP
jgi:uncharacterized protein YjbI with pentapeptide repeats